jgi:glycogen operon protein
MLSQGDELGRTQLGNNNAYCQDNEVSWIDWDLGERARALLDFSRDVIQIRESNPVFRRRRFFAGNPVAGEGVKDVSWIRPDGKEMAVEDWQDPKNRVLGMMIHGEASDEVDERGRPNRGQTLVLLLNGGARSRYFQLPGMAEPGVWREIVNTARPRTRLVKGGGVNLVAHALIVLGFEVPR